MIYIYTLSDNTGVRYVGQTKDTDSRFKQHLADKSDNAKSVWMQSLNYPPRMDVIEITDKNRADEREQFWIEYYRSIGCDLTNTTHNGDTKMIDNTSTFLQIVNANAGWLVKLVALWILWKKPEIVKPAPVFDEDDAIDAPYERYIEAY